MVKKTPSYQQEQQEMIIEQQKHQESSIEASTNLYTKAREWINENVMDWVEFEKIKLAKEKGRALTKAEVAGVKKMRFEVSKIVDKVQRGHIVKWNKYPNKYNTVYNPKLTGNIFVLSNYFKIWIKFVNI